MNTLLKGIRLRHCSRVAGNGGHAGELHTRTPRDESRSIDRVEVRIKDRGKRGKG